MSRRSRVITMASDGRSPRPGVRWPTTLVAPPTGMAIAPVALAQSSVSPTSSSVSGKATPSTIGPTRPKRRRSQSSRLWPTLARRRDLASRLTRRWSGSREGRFREDVGEGRILRRRRLADAFTKEIPARVGKARLDRLLAPAVPSPHRPHPSLAHPHRPPSRPSGSRRRNFPAGAGDRDKARLGQAPAGRVAGAWGPDRSDSRTAGWRSDGRAPCAIFLP